MRCERKQKLHMVQLMEVSVQSGLDKTQHPKLRNKELLSLFDELAVGQEDQRQKCTERLITFLMDQEQASDEGICDDTKYSVRRLVQGLWSARQFARLAYSAALCQLLRSLNKLNIDTLFDSINESSQAYGAKGSSKTMMRNAYIGKVFAYLVLIQSKKLFNGESKQISTVVKDLTKIGATKDYMSHLCIVAISQIIAQIKHKVFQKHVLPHIEERVSVGWSECTPEDLLLVIHAKKYHSKVMESYLTDKWGGSALISESTLSHIAGVFRKTAGLYPVKHSIIDTVVSEVVQHGLDLVEFWKKAVGPLFAGKSNDHTRSVGLHVFEKLIPHLSSSRQVEGILFPDITKQLTHHNKEAVAKVMTLVKSSSQGSTQLSVLKCFIQQIDVPEYEIMNQIVSHFVPEALSRLTKELTKAYTMQPSWLTDKKNMAPWSKWCVLTLNGLVTQGDDAEWQLSILQFLFIHSYFTVNKSADIPHCTRLQGQHPDPVKVMTSQYFTKAITRLLSYNKKGVSRSTQFNLHLDVLFQLAQYGQVLLQKTDCVQLQSQCFNEEASNQWTKMIEFLPKLQDKRSTSEKLGLDHAFELMFIYGGLQLFSDPSAVEFLQELHVCYKKSTQRRKSKAANDDEPAWIEVVTELLLSLMFKGSVLSRNIAKIAMTTLSGHVTTDSLQLILDLLQQKSLDDDEGMVGVEEDEDEEENTDANEDDTIDKDELSSDDDDDDGDDDDDSESDADSGVEEEAGIEVPDNVKVQIKEALGDAAADTDEGSEEEDTDLTDAEMFQLDAKLAEAFKAMNKTKNRKLNKERKAQLLQFKVRSCDLLEAIVKNNPSAHLIKEMIIPLIDRMEGGLRVDKEQVLGRKAKDIFNLIYKSKMVIPDTAIDKDELLELFSDLMKLSVKVSTDDMMREVVKACVVVIRMMFNIQGNADPSPVKTRSKHKPGQTLTTPTQSHDVYQDKLVSLVLSGMKEMFQQKASQGSMGFFFCLLEKNIIMLWPIWKGLVEVIGSEDIKTYSRAGAVKILNRLLNKQMVKELDSEDWSSFLTEIRSLSQKVFKTLGSKDKHFIKELLNLFVKIYQVSSDPNIQILDETEIKILEGMVSDFNSEIMILFRKVYKIVCKKDLPKTQNKRKKETANGGQSSPKKLKLDNQSVTNGNVGSSEESGIVEDVEDMDIEETHATNSVQKKKKKKLKKSLDNVKQISNDLAAITPEKSVQAVSLSTTAASVTPAQTPTNPMLTSSQKKKKKQRQSGVTVEKQVDMEREVAVIDEQKKKKQSQSEIENSVDMETDGGKEDNPENSVQVDENLTVTQSLNNGKSPLSEKKKKRKSDKFSPRYTRSMKS